MVKRRTGPMDSQTWRSFLRNQAKALWCCDFFVQRTVGFRVIYVFVVMELASRKIVYFHVTDHPTLEWTKQQIRNACFEGQPKFLLHDNDGKFGQFGRPLRVENAGEPVSCRSAFDAWLWQEMGIRGIPIPSGRPRRIRPLAQPRPRASGIEWDSGSRSGAHWTKAFGWQARGDSGVERVASRLPDGCVVVVGPHSDTATYCSSSCPETSVCSFHEATLELHKAVSGILTRWTLAHLLEKPSAAADIAGRVACRMAGGFHILASPINPASDPDHGPLGGRRA
jgi:hypothetical protein